MYHNLYNTSAPVHMLSYTIPDTHGPAVICPLPQNLKIGILSISSAHTIPTPLIKKKKKRWQNFKRIKKKKDKKSWKSIGGLCTRVLFFYT